MKTISIEIPDSILTASHLNPNALVNEMRIAAAIKWYELGCVSQGIGAEVANLSRAEFIAALSDAKVSPFDISDEDLLVELHDAD